MNKTGTSHPVQQQLYSFKRFGLQVSRTGHGKAQKTNTLLSTFPEKVLPPFPDSILQIEAV